MPYAMIQFKQRFEPFVEWLHGLTTAAVDRFALPAAVELPTRQTSSMGFVARSNGFLSRLGFRVAPILRTEETSRCAFAPVRPFDSLAQIVAVVAAIRRHGVGAVGKLIDLVVEGLGFLRVGRPSRSQQRKHRGVLRRGNA